MRFFEGISKKKRVSRADAENRAYASEVMGSLGTSNRDYGGTNLRLNGRGGHTFNYNELPVGKFIIEAITIFM